MTLIEQLNAAFEPLRSELEPVRPQHVQIHPWPSPVWHEQLAADLVHHNLAYLLNKYGQGKVLAHALTYGWYQGKNDVPPG
jgi:hypothetical protein